MDSIHQLEELPISVSMGSFELTSRAATQDSRIGTADAAPTSQQNPFTTPYSTQNPSRATSSAALNQAHLSRRYFHSRRIKPGEVEKPWLKVKDPREKWVTIIPLIGLAVGIAIAAFLIWDGLRTVVNHTYCLVYEDDFSHGFNSKVWTKEAEVGGFGNGEFEMTTTTDENIFIRDNNLVIKPTLQDPDLIAHDTIIDLRKQGICTSPLWSNCLTSTNTTNGTIVNPVKSGRINTRRGATIKFGRVEITAKLPQGDWLWPAIWLLPVHAAYGPWPASGEIDVAESRGNNWTYAQGGNDIVSSALHWGPTPSMDAWWRTNVKRQALHTTYARTFHTFGLEWSEKYLFTYVDTRLLQVLYSSFATPFWSRGGFPPSDANGTTVVDPWSRTGRASTPFDEDFYLILNVAVGGTNGWFADGLSGKPWVDASPTARQDFWEARAQWWPTWSGEGRGEMVVSKVAMWQQQGYNGC